MLKIVDLHLRRNEIEAAMKGLADFLDQYPGEKKSDLALLALGELSLKQHYLMSGASVPTNYLAQAAADFTNLITTFTNSEFLGKAYLNLGWCRLAETNLPESEADFGKAAQRLAFSEDAAVARFKLGDLQFLRNDYAGAISNYQEVAGPYAAFPAVKSGLVERALYQLVRAGLAETNMVVATDSMRRVITEFPHSEFGGPGELLVGQALNRQGEAVQARKTLSDFAARFPDSPLLPEVELAIIRSFECEGNLDRGPSGI